MPLTATYKQYLSSPSESFFASDASLNYVTTTTSLSQPASIIKHVKTQQQMVEKKAEIFLNVIENSNSLCIETETTVKFVAGGGVYLPNIDDNFLCDRTVTLPIIHIVIFNDEQKIQQIRLSWDQGSLLKAVDTIGARGRNWPIRDGKDQIKMINTSSGAAPSAPSDGDRVGRRHSRGVDPHSSLNLFQPQEPTVREESPFKDVKPRPSFKPAQRENSELFAAGSTDPAMNDRSPSPSKHNRNNSNPLKAGAGKNFQEHRLFGQEPMSASEEKDLHKAQRGIKTNANKYDHFDFGDGENVVNKSNNPVNKHTAQWGFEDFSTPAKPKSKNISHHQPNFSLEEDNATNSPVYRNAVPQARKENNSHFTIEDSTPAAERTRGSTAENRSRSGLYSDRVIDNNESSTTNVYEKLPLRNITNANKTHNNNLSSHWQMEDMSPDAKTGKQESTNDENSVQQKAEVQKNKPEIKSRVASSFQSSWDFSDNSPPKENRGIKIYGDGMGMRKTDGPQWWEFGDN